LLTTSDHLNGKPRKVKEGEGNVGNLRKAWGKLVNDLIIYLLYEVEILDQSGVWINQSLAHRK